MLFAILASIRLRGRQVNDLKVTVTQVVNGYIVTYSEYVNDVETSAEFVALDLDEALEIVRDCYEQTIDGSDLSNVLDETIPKD